MTTYDGAHAYDFTFTGHFPGIRSGGYSAYNLRDARTRILEDCLLASERLVSVKHSHLCHCLWTPAEIAGYDAAEPEPMYTPEEEARINELEMWGAAGRPRGRFL